MNECTFVILGVTGDLAKRKLIPALYKLIQDKKIEHFIIVGAALDKINAQECLDRAQDFIPVIDEMIWQQLQKSFYYQAIDFNDAASFMHLQQFITTLEKKHSLKGNRIVYLAVPSLLFCFITEQLGKTGLVKTADDSGMVNGIWQRIVYEKPFGLDVASSAETNKCIMRYFNESQIYRVDHYLTKELVSNIVLVRFTNMIFEPLWNKNYIDEVQITLTETLGMEGRGRYYDHYGVLKDVVQNHMMQLMALIGMELPPSLTASAIANQKADVLKKIRCVDGFLGQYKGYQTEKDVTRDSITPTFAVLKMFIDTPRWQGVPFYIKTGKALNKKNTSIAIKFKEVACALREECRYTSNYLTIQIDPEASFSLQLNIKQPGISHEVMPIHLFFSHNYMFGTSTPEAYEVLLEQIMLGDQSISVRFDEIEYAWRVIENIEKMKLPLYYYEQATKGPEELFLFDEKYHIRWHT